MYVIIFMETNKYSYNILILTFDRTLTYWFSSTFRPFNRKTCAWVSKSMVSTDMVSVVRTRLLLDDPVAVSFCTLRIVVERTLSPSEIRLYACHISSGSSGISVTDLFRYIKKRVHLFVFNTSNVLHSINVG